MLRTGIAPVLARALPGAALQRAAAAFSAILARGYWQERFLDRRHGGFSVADRMGFAELVARSSRDGLLPAARWLRAAASPAHRAFLIPPAGKHVVAHARLVWTLAHLLRCGLAVRPERCRAALEHGYRFLVDAFHDGAEGGFFWRTDDVGRVVEDAKLLVAQSFAIYAMVEYARATGASDAAAAALATFRRAHAGLHDERNGGWHEIAGRDLEPRRRVPIRQEPGFRFVPGAKSLNGHLHWMEALTELYRETGDGVVGAALAESVEVCLVRFGGRLAAADAEWRPLAGENDEVSYGHIVELAWLAAEAARSLGREPDWSVLDELVDDALAWGFDSERGGFFLSGPPGRRATRTDKLWWVQAEGLLALLERVGRAADERSDAAFVALVDWVVGRQLDRRRGVWIWATDELGRPSNFVLAASWKAGYHEVRAMSRLIGAAGAGAPVRRGEAGHGLPGEAVR